MPASTTAPVSATLVAAQTGIAPGGAADIAVRLEHQPGWSSFWRSPGGGEATNIEWNLPRGWSADGARWPAPEKVLNADGRIFGNGYGGVIYLPVRISAPAEAALDTKAVASAAVSWLACRNGDCVNGKAMLRIELPILAVPSSNPAVQAALDRQVMPQPPGAKTVSAWRSGKEIVFRLAAGEPVLRPHFFPDNEMIWYDTDQRFEIGKDRALIGRLPIDPFYQGGFSSLSGVLTFDDAGGHRRAISIRVPLKRAESAARRTSPIPRPHRGGPVLQILAMAFLGGLLLNLMPCVLPILSMKALFLSRATSIGARELREDGIAYAAGVLVSFLAFGGAMLVLRAALGGLGWGFQLQQPAVVLALALVMTAVGLDLIGAFEAGSSFQGVGHSLAQGSPRRAAFFTGILAVVVAAPCTAPFMASALGAALVQPSLVGMGVFAAMGSGLAFPYLLLSLLPASRRLLPRPGKWMVTFRQFLAFPMFATAIWLFWVLGGQLGPDGMAIGLASLLALAFAVWATSRGGRVWRGFALAGFLLAAASLFAVARFDPQPAAATNRDSTVADAIRYSPRALDDALASGRPVFAYFTADWCLTCKVNERTVLKRPQTAAFFKARNIVVMVGDWTRQDPQITAMLADYDRAGVPMYVYFPPRSGRRGGILLPQILTPSNLRNGIEAAS